MTVSSPHILITGHTGQVGHFLLPALSGLGRCTVAVGPDDPASSGSPLDLAKATELREFVMDLKPDIIVNPAAYTAVDRAEEEPELARKVNGVAPGVLAEAAEELGAMMVHYSTDYVFPGDGERAWRETDPTNPQNTYGQTKLEGERAVLAACKRAIILRTSWVVSPVGNNFVKTMLRLGEERESLNIVNDQWGSPASAEDLAKLTGSALQTALSKGSAWTEQNSGIYHVTSLGETTWHGIAERVFQSAKEKGKRLAIKSVGGIPTSDYPTPAKRPLNSRLDCSKFVDTFGVKPMNWEQAIDEIVTALV